MSEYKFEPFQKVLVRIGDTWHGDFFSHMDEEGYTLIGGGVLNSENLLPYEGNEHLLGTTDSPKPQWKPKGGDLVAVSDSGKEWFAQVFVKHEKGREEGEYITSDVHDCTQPSFWEYCEPIRKHFNVPEE